MSRHILGFKSLGLVVHAGVDPRSGRLFVQVYEGIATEPKAQQIFGEMHIEALEQFLSAEGVSPPDSYLRALVTDIAVEEYRERNVHWEEGGSIVLEYPARVLH